MTAMLHLASHMISCGFKNVMPANTPVFALTSIVLFPQAKRRLALDDSDHQYQSEPARTPRGRGGAAAANGARLKTPRSKQPKVMKDTSPRDRELYSAVNHGHPV